jgi:hypothetical protein
MTKIASNAERRHMDALALYDRLVLAQTREQALAFIDSALLMARIGGANAQIIAMGRATVRHLAAERRRQKGAR